MEFLASTEANGTKDLLLSHSYTWGANGLVSSIASPLSEYTQVDVGGDFLGGVFGIGGSNPPSSPPPATGLQAHWTAFPCPSTQTVPVRFFYTYDERGNTSERNKDDGSVFSRHISDAYGNTSAVYVNTLDAPSDPADPHSGYGAQYGYYKDAETGLYLCTFRYYDPTNGRFLNRDPAGYGGGLNTYAYCDGNPVNAVDPDGLDPEGGMFRFLKLIEGHWRVLGGTISEQEAVQVLRKGKNIVIEGPAPYSTKLRVGKKIAEDVYGKGDVLFHTATDHRQPVGTPWDHYQSKSGNITGHLFIKSLLTIGFIKGMVEFFDPTPVGATISISKEVALPCQSMDRYDSSKI